MKMKKSHNVKNIIIQKKKKKILKRSKNWWKKWKFKGNKQTTGAIIFKKMKIMKKIPNLLKIKIRSETKLNALLRLANLILPLEKLFSFQDPSKRLMWQLV